MNFTEVNKLLRKEFGKGQVELRKLNDGPYDYILWFQKDNPSKKIIQKAKSIVGQIEPTFWFDEATRHPKT